MNQPISPWPGGDRRQSRRRSYGFARASLIISASSCAVWLLILMPATVAASSPGTNLFDGVMIFVTVFLALDVGGLCMALFAMLKTKLNSSLAIYGALSNVVCIVLNLSLISF
ncbi:hypothetical protein A1507_04425 [Methylomonas koyamae]|uniref:Uncharacterized protein n=3 Tax=Methylomonas koyamae TaxID=702114 RepID=A0A177PFU9_9GAMM|nr:hypothetical protein A1507_04425 [Methylomonas koyamae]OAI28279.1 hypothetical protein A1356_00220 [Methylomonas koyamae]